MATKAEGVRAIILAAKQAGKEPKDIVTEVMEFGNFKRGLARAYINNNWAKVLTEAEQEAVAVVVEAPEVVEVAAA